MKKLFFLKLDIASIKNDFYEQLKKEFDEKQIKLFWHLLF